MSEGKPKSVSATGKARRGFACMDPEKRRELARKGGQSVPKEKRYYTTNKEAASQNGARGGRKAQLERRIKKLHDDVK